ncbi:MAG: J domain-containing protein [Rhodopila sp.]
MRLPSRPDQSGRVDPQGFYALLGVDPAATHEAITHAFRRRALRLHPDVPKTGDKNAFLALRAAYDVLSNPNRRRAYDESAREPPPAPSPPSFTATHGVHDFRPNVADAPWMDDDTVAIPPGFTPRPTEAPRERSGFPFIWLGVGVGTAGVLAAGVVVAVVNFRTPPPPAVTKITATAPAVTPQSDLAHRAALYGPEPVRLAGTPNYYVLPGAGATMLWRQEKDPAQVAPLAQLPPFSSVQALRVSRQTGLVEIRYDDTTTAFVDGRRLAPGDAAAARNAWCGYNAGPVPSNGEVLARRGHGASALQIENRGIQPAVIKLRDLKGTVALSVFLAPNGDVELQDVPDGALTADIAIGELWSRACNRFAAGMRARRFQLNVGTSSAATLVLPLDQVAATDISDQAFATE